MQHVMLDLETWGTVPGCAIRSIGAVVFDPHGTGNELRDCKASRDLTFYLNITDDSNELFGLRREDSTVAWWASQSEAAKSALMANQVSLNGALADFTEWWRSHNVVLLWSHGASFDVPVLAVAYHLGGLKPPWDYRKVRDTRTLYDITALPMNARTNIGVAHNALDDAITQAMDVQSSYRVLRDMAKAVVLARGVA